MVGFDDGLGKRLGGFLGQIVPDAAGDGAHGFTFGERGTRIDKERRPPEGGRELVEAAGTKPKFDLTA